MIWKCFNNSSKLSRTALFTATAPKLPPITKITGLSEVNPQKESPRSLFPSKSSWRIGEPVRTALPFGR